MFENKKPIKPVRSEVLTFSSVIKPNNIRLVFILVVIT